MKNLFLNLILNAAQAMGGRGRIDLAVASIDGHCRVNVRDHGPGIPLEVRDRIFEPFFTTRDEGTGLGLAIARKVVEAHGGEISAGSTDEGGAVIGVRLPLY
ncbi:MAG: ATP-binding protein [Acidobacteria bacterium]|nr:ATP-binding protein [Acidobacteriota bacterium]